MSSRSAVPRSSTFLTPSAARERDRAREQIHDDSSSPHYERDHSPVDDYARRRDYDTASSQYYNNNSATANASYYSQSSNSTTTTTTNNNNSRDPRSHLAAPTSNNPRSVEREASRAVAAMQPSGSYNALRAVPPPVYPRPSAASSSSSPTTARHPTPSANPYASSSSSSANHSSSYYSSTNPSALYATSSGPYPSRLSSGGGGAKSNQLYTRAVVLVDEATEPGIGDIDGVNKRVEIANLVLSGGDPKFGSTTGNSPGAAVAFAIRKRLKSDDHIAVLNALTLVDELMRTCPYFFRYIANDKFFRRMWRFVDPNYKTDIRGRIPFVGKAASRSANAMRSTAVNIEIAERVMILIRAWAEELSIMFAGSQDQDVGFFIERYTTKRARVKFPDVPPSNSPWVCQVGTNPGSSRFVGRSVGQHVTSTTAPLPQSLSIREVENTVNLFANFLEKATDLEEVQSEVCSELGQRCRVITHNLDTITGRMEREEDLARAVKVSELLQKTLAVYDDILATGELKNTPPIVDGLTETESEDEGYEHDSRSSSPAVNRHLTDARSHDHDAPHGPDSGRYDRDMDGNSVDRHHNSQDSHRDLDARSPSPGDRAPLVVPVGRDDAGERESRSREKPKPRKEKDSNENRLEKKESRRQESGSSKTPDRSDSKPTKAKSRRESSESIGSAGKSKPGNSAKTSKDSASSTERLIDVTNPGEDESVGADTSKKNDGAFNLLAERYASVKSLPSKPSSVDYQTQIAQTNMSSVNPATLSNGMQNLGIGTSPTPLGTQNPTGQSHSPFDMSYNPVILMPNPMAMGLYGSYNPGLAAAQPLHSVYSAYNTVNPAMYFSNMGGPVPFHSVPGGEAAVSLPQAPSPAYSLAPEQAAGVHLSPISAQMSGAPFGDVRSLNPSATAPSPSGPTPIPNAPASHFSASALVPSFPASNAGMAATVIGSSTITGAAAPAPPPPISQMSYTTVTNAPAPPPSQPPPMSYPNAVASGSNSETTARTPRAGTHNHIQIDQSHDMESNKLGATPGSASSSVPSAEFRSDMTVNKSPDADQTQLSSQSLAQAQAKAPKLRQPNQESVASTEAQQQSEGLSSRDGTTLNPALSSRENELSTQQFQVTERHPPQHNPPVVIGSNVLPGQQLPGPQPDRQFSAAGALGMPSQNSPGLIGFNPAHYNSFTGHPVVVSPMLYGSISGHPALATSGVLPQPAIMPQMAPLPNAYGSVNNGSLYASAGADQAAMYQNAMAQAAAQYHALASAYQSTQGQAPIQSPGAPLPPPDNSVPSRFPPA